MNKRIIFLLLVILCSISTVFGQKRGSFNEVDIFDKLRLNGRTITYISNDSTFTNADSLSVPTSWAVYYFLKHNAIANSFNGIDSITYSASEICQWKDGSPKCYTISGATAISDGLLSTGPITLVDSTLTIADTIQYSIKGIVYTQTTSSVFTIHTADSGYYRRDLIYADSLGLHILPGVEDNLVGVVKQLPANSVEVTIVDVYGNEIIVPTPSKIGKVPNLQRVTSEGNTTTNDIILNNNNTQSPLKIFAKGNHSTYIYVKNNNGNSWANAGAEFKNNVPDNPNDEHSGHYAQFYMGGTNSSFAKDAMMIRTNGTGGIQMDSDSGRVTFNKGSNSWPWVPGTHQHEEMGAFETNGNFKLDFVDSSNADINNIAYFSPTGIVKRGHITTNGIDSSAYHYMTLGSDSTYVLFHNLKGGTDTLRFFANGGTSGGGSGGGTYTLPIASGTTLGGIKVGSGLAIDGSTGVLSASGNYWGLTGNAGTTSSSNFIGTTDNNPLVIKVFNSISGYINQINHTTSFGYQALPMSPSGIFIHSSAFGFRALGSEDVNTSGGNTAVGAYSAFHTTTGQNNNIFGFNSFYNNTIGNNNNVVGSNALHASISSNSNSVFGDKSLYSFTTGNHNSTLGDSSLYSLTSGSYDIGLGNYAGRTKTTLSNTLVVSDSTYHMYMRLDSIAGIAPNVIGKDVNGNWHVYSAPSSGSGTAKRFGIEDNAGIQNRKMYMNGLVLDIENGDDSNYIYNSSAIYSDSEYVDLSAYQPGAVGDVGDSYELQVGTTSELAATLNRDNNSGAYWQIKHTDNCNTCIPWFNAGAYDTLNNQGNLHIESSLSTLQNTNVTLNIGRQISITDSLIAFSKITNSGTKLATISIPKTFSDQYLPLSVNGTYPDSTGNISLSTGGGTYTASNGLSMVGSDVQLGGTLTSDININGGLFKSVLTAHPAGAPTLEIDNSVDGDALYAVANGLGIGLYASSVSGKAISASSGSGIAVYGSSGSNVGGYFVTSPASTTGVESSLIVLRSSNSIPTNGIGNSIDFYMKASNSGIALSNQLISTFTDATYTTRTSEFSITGVNNAVTNTLLTLSGSGAAKLNNYGSGTFTGTATHALQVDASGNIIEGTIGGGAADRFGVEDNIATQSRSVLFNGNSMHMGFGDDTSQVNTETTVDMDPINGFTAYAQNDGFTNETTLRVYNNYGSLGYVDNNANIGSGVSAGKNNGANLSNYNYTTHESTMVRLLNGKAQVQYYNSTDTGYIDFPKFTGNIHKNIVLSINNIQADTAGNLSIGASNGLTMATGNNIQLGGILSKNTTINTGSSYTLTIDGSQPTNPVMVVNNSADDAKALTGNSTSSVGGTGIYGTALGQGTGVVGSGVSGNGVNGSATTGVGVRGDATSGVGIYGSVTTGVAGSFAASDAVSNAVKNLLVLTTNTTGTASSGMGSSILYQHQISDGSLKKGNELISKWIDAGSTTYTSEFSITGVSNAVTNTLLSISGAGVFTLVQGLTNYVDNAAAIAGGLTIGQLYRNGDIVQIVH